MAEPPVTLPGWATDAAFPAGGDPWSGQPPRDDTGLASLAGTGHIPDTQTDAETFNEWLWRAGEWIEHVRLELAAVIAGYADGSATSTTLVDSLDLKADLAGGNVWTGLQEFDGNTQFDAASNVFNGVSEFVGSPEFRRTNWIVNGRESSSGVGTPSLGVYGGVQDAGIDRSFCVRYTEAASPQSDLLIDVLYDDIRDCVGAIEYVMWVWLEDDAATGVTFREGTIYFRARVGQTPSMTDTGSNTSISGGANGITPTIVATTDQIALSIDTSNNDDYVIAGWFKTLRLNTVQ